MKRAVWSNLDTTDQNMITLLLTSKYEKGSVIKYRHNWSKYDNRQRWSQLSSSLSRNQSQVLQIIWSSQKRSYMCVDIGCWTHRKMNHERKYCSLSSTAISVDVQIIWTSQKRSYVCVWRDQMRRSHRLCDNQSFQCSTSKYLVCPIWSCVAIANGIGHWTLDIGQTERWIMNPNNVPFLVLQSVSMYRLSGAPNEGHTCTTTYDVISVKVQVWSTRPALILEIYQFEYVLLVVYENLNPIVSCCGSSSGRK